MHQLYPWTTNAHTTLWFGKIKCTFHKPWWVGRTLWYPNPILFQPYINPGHPDHYWHRRQWIGRTLWYPNPTLFQPYTNPGRPDHDWRRRRWIWSSIIDVIVYYYYRESSKLGFYDHLGEIESHNIDVTRDLTWSYK